MHFYQDNPNGQPARGGVSVSRTALGVGALLRERAPREQSMGRYSLQDLGHPYPKCLFPLGASGFGAPKNLTHIPMAIVEDEQVEVGGGPAGEHNIGLQEPLCPAIDGHSTQDSCTSGEGSSSDSSPDSPYGQQTPESAASATVLQLLSYRVLAQALGRHSNGDTDVPRKSLPGGVLGAPFPTTNSSGGATSQLSGMKRLHDDLASEPGDGDDRSERGRKRVVRRVEEPSHCVDVKLYACPYYLWDRDNEAYAPTGMHRACKNGTLRLKQHIRRVHIKPAQCLTCGFRGDNAIIDKHTQNSSCSPKYNFERVSRQTEDLNERLTSQHGMSWAQIWTLLFRDTARIPPETEQTIDIGPQLGELEKAMRDFLRPILPSLAQKFLAPEGTTQHPLVIRSQDVIVDEVESTYQLGEPSNGPENKGLYLET